MDRPKSNYLHKTLLHMLKPNAFAVFMTVYYRVAFGGNPMKCARMTTADFMAETGLSRSAVFAHLKTLKAQGLLTFKNVDRPDLQGRHYVDYGVNWSAIPKSTKPISAEAPTAKKIKVHLPTDEDRKTIRTNARKIVRNQIGAIVAEHSGNSVSQNDLDGIVSKLGPLDRMTLDTLARVQFHVQKINGAKPPAYYAAVISKLVGVQ
jgi:hypothetical protein